MKNNNTKEIWWIEKIVHSAIVPYTLSLGLPNNIRSESGRIYFTRYACVCFLPFPKWNSIPNALSTHTHTNYPKEYTYSGSCSDFFIIIDKFNIHRNGMAASNTFYNNNTQRTIDATIALADRFESHSRMQSHTTKTHFPRNLFICFFVFVLLWCPSCFGWELK